MPKGHHKALCTKMNRAPKSVWHETQTWRRLEEIKIITFESKVKFSVEDIAVQSPLYCKHRQRRYNKTQQSINTLWIFVRYHRSREQYLLQLQYYFNFCYPLHGRAFISFTIISELNLHRIVDEYYYSAQNYIRFLSNHGNSYLLGLREAEWSSLHYFTICIAPETDDEMNLGGSGRNVFIKDLRYEARVPKLKVHPKIPKEKIS